MTHTPSFPPVEPPHVDVDQLGDYLDGAVTADERDAIDEHLKCCAACRKRLGSLRLLVEQAAHAPAGVEPDDDLWPAISRAIESRRTLALPVNGAQPVRPAGARWRLAAVIAAAVLAVATASSLATLRFASPRGGGGVAAGRAPTRPGDGSALVRYAALERDYDRAARALWAALEAERATLAPATVATVERSVATIDRAIAEARQALEEDPGNRVLVDMLTASQEQKLDLLRRAAQLSSGT